MNYKVPCIDLPAQYRSLENDILATLRQVLLSGSFILRDEVRKFEKNMASFLEIQHIQKAGNGYYNDFTLGTGKPTSLKELITIILEETGANSKVIYSPETGHDINLLSANAGKAKAILNYEAKISLKQGIKEVVEILKMPEGSKSSFTS